MRTLVLAIVSAVSVAAAGPQQGEIESTDEVAVRAALKESAMGMTTSFTEKSIARLGDAAAVAITKVTAGQTFTHSDIENVLRVLRLAFSAPSAVSSPADRQPRTALFVLNYLESLPVDAALKQKIAETRRSLLAKSAQ